MRSPILRPLTLAGLVAGLCAAHAARAQMLANGDFEQGPVIPPLNPIFSVAPGNAALNGWTVVGGAICIITDNYWVPISGQRSANSRWKLYGIFFPTVLCESHSKILGWRFQQFLVQNGFVFPAKSVRMADFTTS